MPTNWDLYSARLNINGYTKRERYINDLKSNIDKLGTDSPSYKNVLINGVSKGLFINSTNDPYTKNFCDKLDVVDGAGTLINFSGAYWLVESIDPDSEIYTKGIIRMCNYELKFLDSSGKSVSRHCVVESATKYSSGTKQIGSEVNIEIGAGQYTIKLPFDGTTAYFDRTYLNEERNQRILMDYGTTRPAAYRITHADRISSQGLVVLTVTEDTFGADDNAELMIADYYSRVKATPSTPDPVPEISCNIVYSGSPILYYGAGAKTFTSKFTDENGNEITDISPVWIVTATNPTLLNYLSITEISNTIKLKVIDERLVGVPLHLILSNEAATATQDLLLGVTVSG